MRTLGVALVLMLAIPGVAHAGERRMVVCNSTGSLDGYPIYFSNHPATGDPSGYLHPGQCSPPLNDSDGKVRVSSYADYRIKRAGGRYGTCHQGPAVSNPPTARKVWYRTTVC